jgi:hypothetical protein
LKNIKNFKKKLFGENNVVFDSLKICVEKGKEMKKGYLKV